MYYISGKLTTDEYSSIVVRDHEPFSSKILFPNMTLNQETGDLVSVKGDWVILLLILLHYTLTVVYMDIFYPLIVICCFTVFLC